jgi:hypothetical protein
VSEIQPTQQIENVVIQESLREPFTELITALNDHEFMNPEIVQGMLSQLTNVLNMMRTKEGPKPNRPLAWSKLPSPQEMPNDMPITNQVFPSFTQVDTENPQPTDILEVPITVYGDGNDNDKPKSMAFYQPSNEIKTKLVTLSCLNCGLDQEITAINQENCYIVFQCTDESSNPCGCKMVAIWVDDKFEQMEVMHDYQWMTHPRNPDAKSQQSHTGK